MRIEFQYGEIPFDDDEGNLEKIIIDNAIINPTYIVGIKQDTSFQYCSIDIYYEETKNKIVSEFYTEDINEDFIDDYENSIPSSSMGLEEDVLHNLSIFFDIKNKDFIIKIMNNKANTVINELKVHIDKM